MGTDPATYTPMDDTFLVYAPPGVDPSEAFAEGIVLAQAADKLSS